MYVCGAVSAFFKSKNPSQTANECTNVFLMRCRPKHIRRYRTYVLYSYFVTHALVQIRNRKVINEISIQIASILGPVLMIVSSSEYLNFKIWKNVDPTVVALNGLILLICGLTIVRFHNFWNLNWTFVITILGWLIFLAGVFRLFVPNAKQARENTITKIFLIILFWIGGFLAFKSYVN
jgi:hypothetical protein